MVNAASTAKHRRLLEMINADRFADGGMITRGREMGKALWSGSSVRRDFLAEKAKSLFSFGGGSLGGEYTGDLPHGDAVERWRGLGLQVLAAVGAYKLNLQLDRPPDRWSSAA